MRISDWSSDVCSSDLNELPDPVDEDVKQERLARFMQRQADISTARLEARIGSVRRCIVDTIDGELAIARSMADAPEIDGLVQIQDGRDAGLRPGERSEEHTSELQSLMRISYAVFCLKKKKKRQTSTERHSI